MRLPTVLSVFFLYLTAVCFRPSRRELYAVYTMTVLGGICAAVLAYTFGWDHESDGGAVRARIALGGMDTKTNPNTLGRVLILPLALALAAFFVFRGTVRRTVAMVCVGLIGLGVFISMSRAALLAVAVVFSVLFYRLRARKQVVAILVVLAAISIAMPDRLYQRVISGDASGSGRLEIWTHGIKALDDYGIIGAGLDNVRAAYTSSGHTVGETAHNTYLFVWLELGIVGLVLMLAAIATSLLAIRRLRTAGHRSVQLSAMEAACIATLTAAFFGDSIWFKSFWQVWILLTWTMYCEARPDGSDTRAALR